MSDATGRVRMLLVLGLAALAALAGCRSRRAALPAEVRADAGDTMTQAFEAMRGVLVEGAGVRARADVPALRQRSGRIVDAGLALLKARMPHDLQRAWVARYMEGRAVFGDALKAWVRAAEAGGDDALLQAFDALTEAYWGWVDASKGRAPERAV